MKFMKCTFPHHRCIDVMYMDGILLRTVSVSVNVSYGLKNCNKR